MDVTKEGIKSLSMEDFSLSIFANLVPSLKTSSHSTFPRKHFKKSQTHFNSACVAQVTHINPVSAYLNDRVKTVIKEEKSSSY